jgi:hypothetical protein
MGEACATYEREEERQLGKARNNWKDNIKLFK